MERGKVGQRIKTLMEKQGAGLAEMAERTGLDEAFVKRIRDDNVYPSLGPLLKIARALGVRLGTFLDDHAGADPLVVRKSERKSQLSMLRAKDDPVETRFYSLGAGKSDRRMEPFFVELFPESGNENKLSSHEGEEFIIAVSGEVSILYGRETHVLQPGDSIYFNSVVPHHVGCHGNGSASIYAVLYFPE